MTSTPWQELVKSALLGSTQHSPQLEADGGLGLVLKRIHQQIYQGAQANAKHDGDRETALLHAAAVLAIYQRAGTLPPVASVPLPTPSEADTDNDQPLMSAQAISHLQILLADSDKRDVLPEWLAAVAAAGQRVPPGLLPSLLNVGFQQRHLREAIGKVIGNRGRWLAGLHADWHYAAGHPPSAMGNQLGDEGSDEAGWAEGSHATRMLILQSLRQTNPDQARSLVEAAWKTERAPHRAAFLGTFQIGLSLADEPFLESCLDDKGSEVRRHAADLLACLADSRLVARMQERVLPVLRYHDNMIEVRLPSRFEAELERDGVSEQPPHGKGKKAWWLRQMLAAVPPRVWTHTWHTTPHELIQAALRSDWRDLLLSAWQHAAVRHGDAVWAEQLLLVPQGWEEEVGGLWRVLPSERREKVLQQVLETRVTEDVRGKIVSHIQDFSGPWSVDLSHAIVQTFWQHLVRTPDPLRSVFCDELKACALRMPASEIEILEREWKLLEAETPALTPLIAQTLEILHFRHNMLQAIGQGENA